MRVILWVVINELIPASSMHVDTVIRKMVVVIPNADSNMCGLGAAVRNTERPIAQRTRYRIDTYLHISMCVSISICHRHVHSHKLCIVI